MGITTDSKINFRDHILYASQKCTRLIHALSRSAKMNWGLSSKALYSIYIGAILPLMIYGVPVWIKALEKEHNRTIYNRYSSVGLVRERTIPTERPPPVGEVSANFCG